MKSTSYKYPSPWKMLCKASEFQAYIYLLLAVHLCQGNVNNLVIYVTTHSIDVFNVDGLTLTDKFS